MLNSVKLRETSEIENRRMVKLRESGRPKTRILLIYTRNLATNIKYIYVRDKI